MGNNISSNSSEDTIGFRDTNFNKYSSTLPHNHQIELEVSKVIENLPTNNVDVDAEIDNITKQLQQGGGLETEGMSQDDPLGLNSIFKKMEKGSTDFETEMSVTSPFISSEMYNFLMKGGAKKRKSKKSKKSKKCKKSKSGEGIDPVVMALVQENMKDDDDLEATSMTEDSTEEMKKKKNDSSEEVDDDDYSAEDSAIDYDSSPNDTVVDKSSVAKGRGNKKSFEQISSVNTSDIRLLTE